MRNIKELDPALAILAECYKWQDQILEFEMPEYYYPAREQVKEGLKAINPHSSKNRMAIAELNKAIRFFQYALKDLQDESIETGLSYCYALLAALRSRQGEWRRAAEEARKSVQYSDIGGISTTYTDYGIAGAYTILAQIEQARNNTKGAIEAYQRSIKHLETLSHWFENERQNLKYVHLLQRQYRKLSDLYFYQGNFPAAFQISQKSLQLSSAKPIKTLYHSVLNTMPELEKIVLSIKETEENCLEQMALYLPVSRWLMQLMMDEPDLDEIYQLFIWQYRLICDYLLQPWMQTLQGLEYIEKLFSLYEAIRESKLYRELCDKESDTQKISDLDSLFYQIQEDYQQKLTALKENRPLEKDVRMFSQTPAEKELLASILEKEKQYASLWNRGKYSQALKVQEEILDENIKLIHLAQNPLNLEEYRKKHFDLLMEIGGDYYNLGKYKKALDYYHRAKDWLAYVEIEFNHFRETDPYEYVLDMIDELNDKLEKMEEEKQERDEEDVFKM